MAPPVETFHPSDLNSKLKFRPDGKARKPPINLQQCELKEMVQYFCDLDGRREDPKSKVVCKPVLRLFRKCAGELMVETTSWEGVYDEVR